MAFLMMLLMLSAKQAPPTSHRLQRVIEFGAEVLLMTVSWPKMICLSPFDFQSFDSAAK